MNIYKVTLVWYTDTGVANTHHEVWADNYDTASKVASQMMRALGASEFRID